MFQCEVDVKAVKFLESWKLVMTHAGERKNSTDNRSDNQRNLANTCGSRTVRLPYENRCCCFCGKIFYNCVPKQADS